MKRTRANIALFVLLSLGLLNSCTPYQISGVGLDKSSISLLLNQSDSLKATINATGEISKAPVNWSSSAENIADVDDNGCIIGLSKGTATITVECGHKSASCTVTVGDQLTSTFSSGDLEFYSKLPMYQQGGANNYVLSLNGITDTIVILINTPLNAPVQSIPSGTYTVASLTSLTDFSNLKPLTITPGYSKNNTDYGTWLYSKNYSLPVKSGTLTSSVTNGKYTINYNLVDSAGNKLTGNYIDSLDYSNNTGSPYPITQFKLGKMKMSGVNLKRK